MGTTHTYDVVIIGAGPAGMCAALYAGRSMLKAVVLERGTPGGELLNTELVEDYPGFERVLGYELAEKFETHAKKFGAEFRNGVHVTSVRKRDDGHFDTETSEGEVYRSPAVIVTAGGTPVKLGIPGEVEHAGKGVSYCAICDGAFFKKQTIAVVGGGDAATEEADFLTRYADKVYLIHRRDTLRSSKILQAGQVIALSHHEWWDGSGYPNGLSGEAIPLSGRICAVADVFDAVTSVRPYKPAFSNEQACDLLRSERGTHFDPHIVDVFLERLNEVIEIQARYRDGVVATA